MSRTPAALIIPAITTLMLSGFALFTATLFYGWMNGYAETASWTLAGVVLAVLGYGVAIEADSSEHKRISRAHNLDLTRSSR